MEQPAESFQGCGACFILGENFALLLAGVYLALYPFPCGETYFIGRLQDYGNCLAVNSSALSYAFVSAV